MNYNFLIFVALILANVFYGCCSIYKRNRTEVYGFGIVLCVVLIVDMMYVGFSNRDSLDYDTYRKVYYSGTDAFEPGYVFICKLANDAWIKFDVFRNALIAVSLTLSFFSIIRLKLNQNVAIAIYAIVSMTLDFIQMRNFLAFSIVLFSLPCLFDNSKFGKVKYLIGIFFATLIHSISSIYLLLLLYDGRLKKRFSKPKLLIAFFVGSLLVSLMMKINPAVNSTMAQYVFQFDEQKEIAYTMSTLQWGFLLYWLPEFLFLIISWYVRQSVRKINCNQEVSLADLSLNQKIVVRNVRMDYLSVVSDRLFWLNVCIACSLPLCIININFLRIFRNFAIINYSLLPILLELPRSLRWYNYVLLFVVNVILLFWINYGSDIDATFWCFF